MSALERLKAAQAESARLVDELERSLALRGLWPDVFAHGRASSHIVAGMGAGRRAELRRLVVTDGAGESREFPPERVPEVLRGGF